MESDPKTNDVRCSRRQSRRRFLRRAAACSAAACSTRYLNTFANAQSPPPIAPKSDVVEVMMAGLTDGRRIHNILLDEMLETSLRQIANTPTAGDAWRTWLDDDDIVAVKFNRSGQSTIGTSTDFGRALIASMLRADLSNERIMLLEAPPELEREFATRRPPDGWVDRVCDFGSGSDQFRAALDQATAIINVPFLKSHNIAGMTGCLKNLSHGLIMHPARYHADGCSPFIGDIVACSDIRPKLKLNIIDALRVMYDGGPQASESTVMSANLLIASTDPVAADSTGLVWLNRIRKNRNLPPIGGSDDAVPYLKAAENRGLGTFNLDNIQQKFIDF